MMKITCSVMSPSGEANKAVIDAFCEAVIEHIPGENVEITIEVMD